MSIGKGSLRRSVGLRGFTLAEMLTVLSIIILLSVMAIVATSPMLGRNKVRYASRQVHAAILQARSYAIATNSTASIVIYVRDGFCVVTNSVYEPIDAPVVLPEGVGFSVPSEFIVPGTASSYGSDLTSTLWARTLGDMTAAKADGYNNGVRQIMIVTFQQDGTVRYVSRPGNNYTVPTGGVVISIGGGSQLGTLVSAINATDVDFRVNHSGFQSGGGIALIDNEIIWYNLRSQAGGGTTQYYLTTVVRGYMTPARCHKAGAAVFGGGAAMICIFPLTGGVVNAL